MKSWFKAEYQQGRNNKSLLVKANFLEKAMEKYMEIGEREKSNKMKILVKWTYEEYENSNEMNLIRIPMVQRRKLIKLLKDLFPQMYRFR